MFKWRQSILKFFVIGVADPADPGPVVTSLIDKVHAVMTKSLMYTVKHKCTFMRGFIGGGGGQGVRTHCKLKKNKGFLSNAGPDPLKKHTASKPTFNVGQSWARQRNAI